MPKNSQILSPFSLIGTFFALAVCFGFEGPGGPRGGLRGHPPLPPFINNLTRDDVRQYFQIVRNPNETKAQIKNDLQTWARNANILVNYLNLKF